MPAWAAPIFLRAASVTTSDEGLDDGSLQEVAFVAEQVLQRQLRVVEQPGLNQVGLRDPEPLVGGLQSAVVEQRDLSRFLHGQLAFEQLAHPGFSRPVLVVVQVLPLRGTGRMSPWRIVRMRRAGSPSAASSRFPQIAALVSRTGEMRGRNFAVRVRSRETARPVDASTGRA